MDFEKIVREAINHTAAANAKAVQDALAGLLPLIHSLKTPAAAAAPSAVPDPSAVPAPSAAPAPSASTSRPMDIDHGDRGLAAPSMDHPMPQRLLDHGVEPLRQLQMWQEQERQARAYEAHVRFEAAQRQTDMLLQSQQREREMSQQRDLLLRMSWYGHR